MLSVFNNNNGIPNLVIMNMFNIRSCTCMRIYILHIMGQLMDYKHNSYLVVLAVVIFSHSEASSYQRSKTYHNEILLRW